MSANDVPDGFEPTPTGLPSINQTTNSALPEGFEPSPPSNSSSDILTPRGKSIAKAIYSPTLRYGGAAAGAALGAPEAAATGPLAPAVEVAAGAGGYAIGASLSDKLDQLIGLTPPPSTVGEIAGKTAQNIVEGGQQELGGRITGKGIEAGLNAAVGAGSAIAVKGPEKLAQISAMAKNLGIDLTPAELAGTKMLGTVEKIFDTLPWTSDILNQYRLTQMQKLNATRDTLIANNGSGNDIEELGLKIKNMADDFMQKVGTVNKTAMAAMKDRLLQKVGSDKSYEDLDISAKQAVQQYQKELSEQTSQAYDNVAAKIPDQSIVPKNTIDTSNAIIKDQERVAPSARNTDLLKAAKFFTQTTDDVPQVVSQAYQGAVQGGNAGVKAQLENEYPGLLNPQSEKSYSDLAANVKAFNLKKYAQVDTGHGTYQISKAGSQWDDLIGALHDDMSSLVSSSENPELNAAHDIANGLYKQKMALFEDPAFKMINDKYPGAVANTILKGSPELVDRYHALVGDNLFNKAKDRLTNDVLGLNEGDIVNGDDIRKNILDLGETAKHIYSTQDLTYFKKLADAVDTRSGATNDLLNNPLLKKMTSTSAEIVPSGIAKSIVIPNNAGSASAVENMLGTGAKKKIADAFLPQLLSTNQMGDFLPQTFSKEFDTYGRKTIEAWYGKDTADQLQNLADIGRRMKGAQATTVGGVPMKPLIGFYAAESLLRGAAHAVTHPLTPAAYMSLGTEGAVILGSRQLARLYTNPEGRSIFLHGLITPQGSKAAGQLSSKIMSIVGNETLKKAQGN